MIDFEALERDGFVPLKGVIDHAQLAAFEAQLDVLARSSFDRKGLDAPATDPLGVLLKRGGDFRVRLFSNLKNLRIVQEMNQAVIRRLDEEGFFEWAKLKVPLVYPSLRADPPGEAKYLLPLHQDYATQCQKAWRLWITLRDANEKTGSMRVLRSSHKLGFIAHDTSDPAHPHVPLDQVTGFDDVVLDLPAGDGIILNPLLVHASVPAKLAKMKYVLLVQVQDLATLSDPEDASDPLVERLGMAVKRDLVRG